MISIYTTEDNGALVFRANNDGRKYLAECYALGGYQLAEDVAIEAARAAGLEFIQPEQIGALTEAPIFGDLEEDDDGAAVKLHSCYWYPDYQIKDPWEQLKNTGRVSLPAAPSSEA